MSTGELLSIEPVELKFPFELKKQISCSLQLSNKTDNYVAFKVKTTNPKKYCVRPNTGVVLPRSTCDVIVTMQAQKEPPADMQCKDKFLLQSVKVNDGVAAKDITAEMFSKEAGHIVEECKLRVIYVSPPQPPSPVPEGSEEGSSPRGSVSDNGNANGAEFAPAMKASAERIEPQDKTVEVKLENSSLCAYNNRMRGNNIPVRTVGDLREVIVSYQIAWARALISKLTEEKSIAVQQNNKLRQELGGIGWGCFGYVKDNPMEPLKILLCDFLLYSVEELLKREGNKNRAGVSSMFVILVGLLGILLGYLMKKS
ncbi:hypothetical protein JRO89_XS13G0055700 [Xanthoceras sorbifolium]|uniref:MSP domain-containing protein n=1 Tax=Xanthoceras sorbifolium TaxID=99658 RepID=A0ABQ8H6T8_9ROSI|nr:hypothetical protein JRO89_XS13G0055700 [Xanthoceras sorbifolium]